jgi:L-seryl-tRNA(Ser) seleniumtransferase
MTPEQSEQLRALPAVGELLRTERADEWRRTHSHTAVANALREAIENVRGRLLAGDAVTPCDAEHVLDDAEEILASETKPTLRRVINATGVVLHTGLGRAPLCSDAVNAIADAAGAYCNLELQLDTGKRGRRTSHVAELLCKVTGAEAATVVNNNAAAVLLTLRALCEGHEVVVSRGQLVEIGGSFRMPDVMAAGGVTLREVGTTNRTRLSDYANAINENTAALLRVHHSNFRIEGFSQDTPLEQIARCAHEHNLIAIDDLGSGATFDFTRLGLPPEPYLEQSLAAGIDVVCFSGDKLLGGPQAGIIVGRKDLVAAIESHPLMRTYRLDKMVLLALEATLRHHAEPLDAVQHIPALNMMHASTDTLAERARALDQALSETLPGEKFFISSDVSYAGGGSLPGEGLPTVVIRWQPTFASVGAVAAAMRQGDPPVITRISDGAICFDLRTLYEGDFPAVASVASNVSRSGMDVEA